MAYFNAFAASMRSLGVPFLSSSKTSVWLAERAREIVEVAFTNSVLGKAAVEEEESGGGDFEDLEPVRPRKTLARPPERNGSGEEASSPVCGDMCSAEGLEARRPTKAR